MWLSDRRAILTGLAASLTLAACGFTPAYDSGGSGTKLRNHVLVDAPENQEEFVLVERLEDRLGRNSGAPLTLSYSIVTETDGLAITPDQETLRYHLTGTVDYTLTDRATGSVLTRGRAESFTSYSAIGTTVATRASENDAERRLMTILADQIVTQMLASNGTWQQ